jgi:Domain of unknown function (DUF4926)
MPILKEFERVALTVDLPEVGFAAGDVGTVVDITTSGNMVTLEFFNFAGKTIGVVPVSTAQVRTLGADEVLHSRPVTLRDPH